MGGTYTLKDMTIFRSLIVLGTILIVALSEKVNVHLVPHTHDDVGWLKTVDQYYYGANKTIQDAGVQYILDTVMDELGKNPDRKFIYVEIAFFYRWWNEQTELMKEKVRGFVKNRQLEFINGGWCMNDEATADYNAIIDQMTLGLKFIENTFGPEARPTVGWHIDPFGHSAEQAALFSQMGFNGFFFARIDYDDKNKRLNTSTMEMIWRGSESLKNLSDIFTGVLYAHYNPPKGFCFDQFCKDNPIQDDPNLSNNNVVERVDAFVKLALDQAKHYRTNNIMMTMGSDFQYSNARMWFKNLDKLIKYVNKNGTVHAMYSTPSIYLDYVNKANQTWTVKTDDFFPYASSPYSYWTGYFTSRPSLKHYVRKCNNHLQACKQLEAIVNGLPKTSSMKLKMAMGVAQHHDAVSGTEKQHVANDYAKRLHIGEVECREVISAALNHMMVKDSAPKMDLKFCEYLNISVCPTSESGNFNLVAYNPLGRPYQWYLRFPVSTMDISVLGPNGKEIPVQVTLVSNITQVVRRNLSEASYEAVISLMSQPIPPLGYSVYTVRVKSITGSPKRSSVVSSVPRSSLDDVTIANEYYQVQFSGANGHISKITNIRSSISAVVDQQIFWYNSSAVSSNAYIFRPNSSLVFPVNQNGNNAKILNIHKGELVSEVQQEFSSWASQSVRLYHGLPMVEISFTIGPIPFQDGLGKEIISRFDTDLKSSSTFYTDANGREMQKRIRNHRPTWKYNNTAPVAGNYYPVNSRIFIKDEETGNRQFTVLTDRSQGGSSLYDGSLELMLHRRTLHLGNGGTGEPLNETGQFGEGLIIRGKQYVILDNLTSSTYLHRMFGEALMLEPELALAKSNSSFNDLMKDFNLISSVVEHDLPSNVHLLTLELLEPSKYLLRLEHQFEDSDPVLNTNVSVSLNDIFSKFTIKEVTELSLGGNADLRDIKRLSWKTLSDTAQRVIDRKNRSAAVVPPDYNVQLLPMEIRTFNVTVSS